MVEEVIIARNTQNNVPASAKKRACDLYCADTLKQACENVFDLLRAVDSCDLKHKHIVIVPDNMSFTVEKAVLQKVTDCTFNIEVLSFSRLLYKCSSALSGKKYLSTQGGIMAVAKIILDNADKLTCFGKGNAFMFAEEIYKLIIQFKSCGILPQDIICLDAAIYKNLATRINDISLVYGEYEKFLSNNLYDNVNKLQYLSTELLTSDYIKNATVYILGFNNFTVTDRGILASILARAESIVFSFVYDSEFKQYLNEGVNSVFSLLEKLNMRAEVIQKNGMLTPVKSHIKKYMLSYNKANIPLDITNEVVVYKAMDIFDECEFIASTINGLTKHGGYRYSDIAIVCEDFASYQVGLSSIFGSFNIPFFHDEGVKLSEHTICKFLICAIRIGLQNCSKFAYLELAKNFFSGVSYVDCCDFENYCYKYIRQYGNFDQSFTYCKDGDEQLLQTAEKVRQQILHIVKELKIPTAGKISAYCDTILGVIKSEQFILRIGEYSKLQNSKTHADYTAQVATAIEKLFAQMQVVFLQSVIDNRTFLDVFSAGCEGVDLAVIPSYIDNVFCSNIYDSRLIDKRAVFLLGAVDGVVPLEITDNKLFTDSDLRALKVGGLDITPNIQTVNTRSGFALYQLLLSFEDRLFISYFEKHSELGSSHPSKIIRQITETFSNCNNGFYVQNRASCNVFLNKSLSGDERSLALGLGTYKRALLKYSSGARMIADGFDADRQVYSCLFSLLKNSRYKKILNDLQVEAIDIATSQSIDFADSIYFKHGGVSCSQLEAYFSCPFKHYGRYGLKLFPREEYEVNTADVGTYLHLIVEQFTNLCSGVPYDRASCDGLVNNIILQTLSQKQYVHLMGDDIQKGIFNRLSIEAKRACYSIRAFMENSDFKVVATEKEFYKNNGVYLTNDGKISFTGKVDRIDACGDAYIVIDYKTGQNDIKFGDLFYGKKLQLFVYMLTLAEGNKKPCGVYYFPISDSINDSELLKMKGVQINETRLLKALDKTLSEQVSESSVLPLKATVKDGILNYKSGAGLHLITREQFDKTKQYTQMISKTAVNEILEGNIALSPCSGLCEHCDFSSMCGFDPDINDTTRVTGGKIGISEIEEAVNKCNN